MACQSKTYINDLGSDVVAEVTSQLNRALVQTPLGMLQYPSPDAGTDGAATFGTPTTPDADKGSGILFTAPEDCFVTSIKMMTIGARLSTGAGAGDVNSIVILQVPATWSSDNGAGVVVAHTQLVVAGGVNGNSVAVALGGGVSTYTVRYLSDGTIFTIANGRADGQLFDLGDVAAAGGALADEYTGTLISGTHGVTLAVSLPTAGFNMNAGDTLVWGLENITGSAVTLMGSVAYRPVKDSLTLSPAVPVKTFNSVAR